MEQMLWQLLLLFLGFVCLVKGADWFVDGAADLAGKFGISEIVIGLTIVAMGTSLPETSVSLNSAIKDSGGITIGNVLGSNIVNILLILGVSALFSRLPVDKRMMRYEMPFLLGMTVLLPCMGLFDHTVGRMDGAVLLLLMAVYLIYLLYRDKGTEDATELKKEKSFAPLWKILLLISAGLGSIVLGSELAVDAAIALARMIGISERVIGLTVVAIGTSLPELVTSVAASRKGETDIAVGNIVGSNIFNILFVTGLTAVIVPVDYQQAFRQDSIIAVCAVALFYVCLLPKRSLGRISGILMILSYAAYTAYLICSG